jgi:hypothetical protein
MCHGCGEPESGERYSKLAGMVRELDSGEGYHLHLVVSVQVPPQSRG